MGTWVLRVPTLVVVVVAGSLGFGGTAHEAEASPPLTAFTSVATPTPVAEAGWRRCPAATRPASCGQYRYWNGDRCVDARYNNPYLGPR
jgi:hypothetical protein